MAQDFIQIYPPDAALCTEARQQLYTDLLENVELGEFKKKTFAPALKRLCLEGQIESRDERIGALRDPAGRINPLGTYVHAYLCLASPVVSEEAFAAILRHYRPQSLTDMAIELVRYFDGTRLRHPGPQVFLRMRCLVRTLAQVIPATSFQYLCGDMFSRFLSRACHDESLDNCMVSDCWDGVDQFVGMGRDMESIHTLATDLFSGKVRQPAIYQDSHVVLFCTRYFQRQLGPHLLALLDAVYQAILAGQRLRWEQGVLVVKHIPRREEWDDDADEAAGDDSAGPGNSDSAQAPALADASSGPIGTGFFCLARSATPAHSRAVENTLRGTVAQPESTAPHILALAPFAGPEALQRVDATTLLLGWEAEFAPEAGRDAAAACTAAGCQVLAPALWLESGEVLHLHGLGPGEPWRFSRAHGANSANSATDKEDDDAEVRELPDLLAVLLARADGESPGQQGAPPR